MSKKPESSDTFTDEQIEAVQQEIRDHGDNESYWPVMDTGLAIRLILQARAERDAAVARVRELERELNGDDFHDEILREIDESETPG